MGAIITDDIARDSLLRQRIPIEQAVFAAEFACFKDFLDIVASTQAKARCLIACYDKYR